MTKRQLTLLAVCGALAGPLFASQPARAQAPAAVDADLLKKQREVYDRGNKLYDQGRLKEAEVAYLEAWKLKKSYDVAGNLGTVELANGNARSAAEHLSFALREFPAGGKPALRDELVKQLAEAKKRVGLLRVTVSKEGAEVLIDGEIVGKSPLTAEIYVTPGQHALEARHEDFPAAKQGITIEKGEQQEIALTLVAKKKSAAIIGVGMGLTAAAAGAGIALIAVSGGKASDADTLKAQLADKGGTNACGVAKPPADCAKLLSLNKDSDTFHNAAIGVFVGAGAIGVATLIYALYPTKKGGSASTGMLLTPVLGGGTTGAVWSGSF